MIEYPLSDLNVKLELFESVFEPTTTTRLLADQMADVRGKTVLDLGCGNGPIAIAAALLGAREVYAVDIMEKACEATMHNARLNGVGDRVHVLNGSLFEPLDGMKFDVIIDDVSGMAEEVSRLSPWYPSEIPTGGDDGTGPTIKMLEQSPDHLNENGELYFPVISLAKAERILTAARGIYGDKLRQVASKLIPFCRELQINMDTLTRLKNQGIINFLQIRSRCLWTLDIYRAAL